MISLLIALCAGATAAPGWVTPKDVSTGTLTLPAVDYPLAGAQAITLTVDKQPPCMVEADGANWKAKCDAVRLMTPSVGATLAWRDHTNAVHSMPIRMPDHIGSDTEVVTKPDEIAEATRLKSAVWRLSDTPWFSGIGAGQATTEVERWKKGGVDAIVAEAAPGAGWSEVAVRAKEQPAPKKTCSDIEKAKERLKLYNGRSVCIDLNPEAVEQHALLGGPDTDWSNTAALKALRHDEDTLELLPGEWLTVYVLNGPDGLLATPNMGGVVEKPQDGVLLLEGNKAIADVAREVAPEGAVRAFHFAPRPSGKVWRVDFTTLAADGEVTLTHSFLEVAVRNVYIGAVRLGVGMTWVPGDSNFETVTMPGTTTTTIVDMQAVGRHDDANVRVVARPEIVLGYTGFVAPRAYALGRHRVEGLKKKHLARIWQYTGIYAGLGVLGYDGASIQALTSAYLGLEIEPIPDFGIVVAGVARRGEALNYPYDVGDQFSGDASKLTSTVFRPGVAILLNLSPAFFRANPSTAAFVKTKTSGNEEDE